MQFGGIHLLLDLPERPSRRGPFQFVVIDISELVSNNLHPFITSNKERLLTIACVGQLA